MKRSGFLARWSNRLAALLRRAAKALEQLAEPGNETYAELATRFPNAPEHWLRDVALLSDAAAAQPLMVAAERQAAKMPSIARADLSAVERDQAVAVAVAPQDRAKSASVPEAVSPSPTRTPKRPSLHFLPAKARPAAEPPAAAVVRILREMRPSVVAPPSARRPVPEPAAAALPHANRTAAPAERAPAQPVQRPAAVATLRPERRPANDDAGAQRHIRASAASAETPVQKPVQAEHAAPISKPVKAERPAPVSMKRGRRALLAEFRAVLKGLPRRTNAQAASAPPRPRRETKITSASAPTKAIAQDRAATIAARTSLRELRPQAAPALRMVARNTGEPLESTSTARSVGATGGSSKPDADIGRKTVAAVAETPRRTTIVTRHEPPAGPAQKEQRRPDSRDRWPALPDVAAPDDHIEPPRHSTLRREQEHGLWSV